MKCHLKLDLKYLINTNFETKVVDHEVKVVELVTILKTKLRLYANTVHTNNNNKFCFV